MVVGAEGSFADTIVIKAGGGDEEYSGRVVQGNQKSIVFDIECGGTRKIIEWGTQLKEIRLNKRCRPAMYIEAGGFSHNCRTRFMIVDTIFESEGHVSKFSITDGVIIFGAGTIDVGKGLMLSKTGEKFEAKGIVVSITNKKAMGWC